MRIGRFQADGEARIGVFEDGTVRDVTEEFDGFQDALSRPEDAADADGETFDRDSITHLPPTTRENTVFCAALNYEAHAEESDIEVPEWPLVFMKLPRTLVGHGEPISYHTRVTEEIDYEAELAAVIGEPARHVDAEDALDHVAGYTILNDTSARDLQLGLQVGDDDLLDWFSGKAMERTTPVGPYVAVDEIDDPQDLDIASRVDGETMQDDNTGMMIRTVADLVAFVSSRVRLEPGDVIATGTPEGVGTFQDIQLHPGETVEVEVEGVGTLVNTVEEVDE
ncbi:2-keto-4-pentenoate hydratase/2-oxohepta-3-ene-1,7-dioic acid hydratase (catechol pathway) [Natronoarchaeum philippinense]|uniref:2-keto-4-pentenoate hydratase/2-oxohepta-3-ene-1,7-dioic acid hydratase (Catechol pathway) n=1 Tax=Natronoarchaeum philippinense TaxID=558529 RepID=A0A285P0D6_NATPI|nr:fumarylacetoacetate hydrolase family protein [Natronoarchaeum philippinense]SNZ15179.1 2-keto-4-pentenoate hydratase/2-oxohepta-3-ene-1,7-dioic acid hydratase (catechol pathway) [Natronoarchaeum philippinense]